VVVDAEGQTKRTRPLSGVNGEVCKKRKKSLDRADILRDEIARHHSLSLPLRLRRLWLVVVYPKNLVAFDF